MARFSVCSYSWIHCPPVSVLRAVYFQLCGLDLLVNGCMGGGWVESQMRTRRGNLLISEAF